MAAAVVVVITTTLVVVLGLGGGSGGGGHGHAALPDPLPRIGPSAQPVALEWTPVTPPADGTFTALASGPSGTVAVGSSGSPNVRAADPPPTPTIWFSADGATWQPVHTEAPEPRGPLGWRVVTLRDVHAVGGRFVVTASVDDPVEHTSAALFVSDDGRSWARVDPAQFAPTTDNRPNSRKRGTYNSTIYDVTGRGAQIVVLGEVYANSRTPSGLMAATWTSRDGLTWDRRLADLGDGFDPYFTSGAVRGSTLLASGRMGRFPAIMWRTRDLRRWTSQDLTGGDGIATVESVGRSLFAAGGVLEGPFERQAGQPTIWWSRDGRVWVPVLRLGRLRSGTRHLGTTFNAGAATGRLALALAPYRDSRPQALFASRDGRTWSRAARVPAGIPGIGLRVIGTGTDAVYVRGVGLWRVTAP